MAPKVLIVDDEPHIVELVRVCLEECNYQILDVADGAQAMVLIREALPDLVLLDVMIPRKDGYSVCRELKADPATSHIPVVMFTARGLEADLVKGLEAGADAYVTKPFSPMKLLAQVQELLPGPAGAGA